MKECNVCKKVKNETEFYKNKTHKDGLYYHCKKCQNEYKRKSNKFKNEIKVKENKKLVVNNLFKRCCRCGKIKEKIEFYKNKNYKDGLCYHCKECQTTYNKEFLKNNPEKNYEYVKKWAKKFPEKARQLKKNKFHKRRFLCKDSDITTKFLVQLKENTKNCPICHVELNEIQNDPRQYNLDHVIALINGGKHIIENVRYICKKCNIIKAEKEQKKSLIK